jgi:hypothetical protein
MSMSLLVVVEVVWSGWLEQRPRQCKSTWQLVVAGGRRGVVWVAVDGHNVDDIDCQALPLDNRHSHRWKMEQPHCHSQTERRRGKQVEIRVSHAFPIATKQQQQKQQQGSRGRMWNALLICGLSSVEWSGVCV